MSCACGGQGKGDPKKERDTASIIFSSLGAGLSTAGDRLSGDKETSSGKDDAPDGPLSNPIVIVGIAAGVLGGAYLLLK